MFILRLQHRQVTGAIPGIVFVLLLAYALTPNTLAAVIPSSPLNEQQSNTALVFYAQPQVSEDLWPVLFQALRADLADGAGELPNGVVLDKEPTIVRGNEDLRGVTFSKVISVKLLGRCDVLPQTDHPSQVGPLGWVLLVSGTVQPFISIDCTRLAQVLRPAAAHLSKEGRRYAMAQAISHVLIHEWSHIAAQNSAHSARGLTQAYLSVNDLIASPRSNHLSASNR
jgi:hypothetical protein